MKLIENNGTRSDEAENTVLCTPPKKKRLQRSPLKKDEKCNAFFKSSPEETVINWSNIKYGSTYKSPDTLTFLKYRTTELRQELPKKRWLREATMEQTLDNCRLMNQSRPTVLVRAEPRPASPPWTPTTPETPRLSSTPVLPLQITSLLTPPDSTQKPLTEHEFYHPLPQVNKADEELACPLPSDDEVSFSHPLNLSQN